jgi:hypothetical protein
MTTPHDFLAFVRQLEANHNWSPPRTNHGGKRLQRRTPRAALIADATRPDDARTHKRRRRRRRS